MRVESVLKSFLRGWSRVVVLAVGNRLRKDDGFGVYVGSALRRLRLKDVLILEAGMAPEMFLTPILEFNPSHLIVVDSIYAGLKPGAIVVSDCERLTEEISLSTHRVSMRLLAKYLRFMGFKGKILIVGVQPEDLSLGEGLSPKVEEAKERVVEMLTGVLSNH